MPFSRISPDAGTITGLLQAVGVVAIYRTAMPRITDIRSAMPHDDDVEKARRAAAIESAALVGLVFVVTRNFDSFIIGGAALVIADYMFKHANSIHPNTGKVDASTGTAPQEQAFPMPEYVEVA